jgi:hypothetical protein
MPRSICGSKNANAGQGTGAGAHVGGRGITGKRARSIPRVAPTRQPAGLIVTDPAAALADGRRGIGGPSVLLTSRQWRRRQARRQA